ncbi:hypothetical protein ABT275_37165 [Streptomyces sp. NPDC001185]|uniref:hypothetical protein n=1 Tax=Streptomyces sp. NPDC001185 TaxID=3154380 RepID=UPI0033346083
MRQTKPLPVAVRRWAEQRIGPVTDVRDAPHDWERSRVWELEGRGGGHWYMKVSPSVKCEAVIERDPQLRGQQGRASRSRTDGLWSRSHACT